MGLRFLQGLGTACGPALPERLKSVDDAEPLDEGLGVASSAHKGGVVGDLLWLLQGAAVFPQATFEAGFAVTCGLVFGCASKSESSKPPWNISSSRSKPADEQLGNGPLSKAILSGCMMGNSAMAM